MIEQEVSRDLWNRVNSRLSPMEKQVLQFYLDGNNYMQIAGLMKKKPEICRQCITENTSKDQADESSGGKRVSV